MTSSYIRDLHFRFSTGLLRRLGEELNPSLERGIIELAKNAYDADATTFTIDLSRDHRGEDTVTVVDDGAGMTAVEIRDAWLVLGDSKKRGKRTPKFRRIPAGNKGLGRLAALRMGRVVTLTTRPEGTKESHSITINWDDFDKAGLVEDVDLSVETTRDSTARGTTITISHLRNPIGRVDVKRLSRELLLLANPFADEPGGFSTILNAPDHEDIARLVSSGYFRHSDYHLVSRVDNGVASAEVIDFRGRTLFRGKHAEIAVSRQGKPYKTVDSILEFWTYILNRESFSNRPITLQEVREWLQTFGGIHLYEDGLRVHPYGNEGNDWLDLNLQRVRSPEERPSTNNSIGRVSLSNSDRVLIQKTDRSGYIENEPFLELREFAKDSLDWLARKRLELAELRRRKQRTEVRPKVVAKTKKAIQTAINKLPQAKRPELARVIDEYEKSRDDEVKELRKEVQLYRTLSTAGITAATFAHESAGSPIKVITTSISVVERRAKKALKARYATLLGEPVESIVKATEALAVLGSATLRLVDHEKRRTSRVNVLEVIQEIKKTFEPFLEDRQIGRVAAGLAPRSSHRSGRAGLPHPALRA